MPGRRGELGGFCIKTIDMGYIKYMVETAKLLIFTLEGQRYALALATVERVIRPVEVTPLPKSPEIVPGIINIHGTIVPVFDVRKRFRLPEKEIGAGDQMIVARTSSRTVSFGVDGVDGLQEIPQEEIVPHGEIHPGLEYVEGVVKLADGMALIHDLERFLSADEGKKLDKALKKTKQGQ